MEGASHAGFAARLRSFMARCEPDDLEFSQLALELFRLQVEHVPIYRELCESRGIAPDSIKRWHEIPSLPTDSFKDFEVTSIAPEKRTSVFLSSGTTGQDRGRHFHEAESLALYEASLRPWFRRHFLPDETRMSLLILTPSRLAAPNSSLAHMFDTVASAFPWAGIEVAGGTAAEGAWEVDNEKATEFLRTANTPMALLGTAFSFVHLLDGMSSEGLRLPEGSRVLETGGYKGRSRTMPKAELHDLISRHLGIHPNYIVSEYGMSELGSQAYDRTVGKKGGGFRFPPWAKAVMVCPETGRVVSDGESGLLRIFDLANVSSVLALQTGDLALRRGDAFELLGRAEAATARGCSLMAV